MVTEDEKFRMQAVVAMQKGNRSRALELIQKSLKENPYSKFSQTVMTIIQVGTDEEIKVYFIDRRYNDFADIGWINEDDEWYKIHKKYENYVAKAC